jgi:DNA-binding CsgD family transcriptional regulator
LTITAQTFVDRAEGICSAACDLDVRTAVLVHHASGRIGLVVDNFVDVTDDYRRWVLTEESWRETPVLIELRRRIAIIDPAELDLQAWHEQSRAHGYVGVDREPIGIPLLGPTGWFGTIMYAGEKAPGATVERQLVLLATELSVWSTARGIATLPDVRPLARRQHEIATLAASGRTNSEIADALGISINTVKLRLKQAFERLGVESRTALVSMFQRLAPLDGIPPGITRRDTVTITRDAMPTPSSEASTQTGVAH